jgi:alginate O-acetyltransferase complex protein AlgI
MLFNSVHYLFFFPITVALYYLCPHRWRWGVLLAASCYFYMAFIPQYILILFFLILIDYVAAIVIDKAEGPRRRAWLVVSLLANLGLLGVFKYYNFFTGHLTWLAHLIGLRDGFPRSTLILPIGLSFHTFQSLSYTIEVYRRRFTPERHLGIYAVYVLFFPQMVAGPIERPYHLLTQLRQPVSFSYDRAVSGLRLILLGMLKKVLIADNLAILVDAVYGRPTAHAGPVLSLATYAFAIQIYCDFSGYSDIARGSARFMGIELMRNFSRPYWSQSIQEFWTRWHISLSSWFRDYLYIPLGGNRVAAARQAANLMIVFVVSGLWHGAASMYVAWGALHGGYAVVSRQLRRWFPTMGLQPSTVGTALRILITFHLCCFAWIFFRANSLGDAVYIARHLGRGWSGARAGLDALDFPKSVVLFYAAVVGLFVAFEAGIEHGALPRRFLQLPMPLRWTCYVTALAMIVLGGRFEARRFIYFQF